MQKFSKQLNQFIISWAKQFWIRREHLLNYLNEMK